MYKAILWDNDGVLVDTEQFYFQANREILARYQIDLTESLFRDLYLTQAKGAWHLIAQTDSNPVDIPCLTKERNERYLELLQTEDFRIEGVEHTLESLSQHFTMGVVTSSRRVHFDMIHSRTAYLRFFDLVLTREDYENSKPDPEPYLKALSLLSVKPAEALVIEDSQRGLMAAKRAGLTCWVIPNRLSAHGDFAKADRVLGSIYDVKDRLLNGHHRTT